MTHDDALEALADHPHSWRFRQLCADDSDPERRDAWRARVVVMAAGGPIAPPPPVRVDLGGRPPGRPCCGGGGPAVDSPPAE